ncbi:MAG: hypothetical protein Q9217_005680 [Psora testacea]
MQKTKKVAVVGSGCSGIGALWALKTTKHEIHLYEAKDRLGGHTNTVRFKHGDEIMNVDTGFIVMNSATYPNFTSFLKHIGVATVPTEMTFGVSRDRGLFEWAGTSLSAVFAQRKNILKPTMWQMIFDIVRFNQFALDLLAAEEKSEEDPSGANGYANGNLKHIPKQSSYQSIGEYLDENHYSNAFRNDYLIPMTASVWSTSPDKASLEFPAITLIRFMWNHHLLNTVAVRPPWMTIPGGSKQYVDKVLEDFPEDRVHLSTGIKLVRNTESGVLLQSNEGVEEAFDHVILATHGDQAASIIAASATDEEQEIMSGFKTSCNKAVLHSDLSLMPTRPLAWSSWNYITTSRSPGIQPTVCLTYWMNLLQHIPSELYGPVLVTLNPLHPTAEHLTQGEWTYHHPLYNIASIKAQELLPRIQNTRGISYAGAWTKYGFHEDGFSSGLKVAVEHLGAELPFEFVDSTFSRGRRPVLRWSEWLLRLIIWLIQAWIAVFTIPLGMVKRVLVPVESRKKIQ